MTNSIQTGEHVSELHAVVEAFLDGETVAPSMLRAALGDRAARDHFVDLLIVRGALNRMDSMVMSAGARPQGSAARGRWLAAVAAALAVSLTAGYVAGQRALAATNAPSTVEALVVADSAPEAPPPTRSITFKPGVNWTDSSKGR